MVSDINITQVWQFYLFFTVYRYMFDIHMHSGHEYVGAKTHFLTKPIILGTFLEGGVGLS